MLTQIEKYSHVSGASIYACNDVGASLSTPSAIDVSITLPALEFESADVNFMGTLSVPDTTRLGNLQITASLEADNPKTRPLIGAGLKKWRISWTENIITPAGLQTVKGFTVHASGYVTSVPEGSKEVGSQALADFAMNCVAISKKDSDGHVYYDIDRAVGKLIVDGVDYRAQVNELL